MAAEITGAKNGPRIKSRIELAVNLRIAGTHNLKIQLLCRNHYRASIHKLLAKQQTHPTKEHSATELRGRVPEGAIRGILFL